MAHSPIDRSSGSLTTKMNGLIIFSLELFPDLSREDKYMGLGIDMRRE